MQGGGAGRGDEGMEEASPIGRVGAAPLPGALQYGGGARGGEGMAEASQHGGGARVGVQVGEGKGRFVDVVYQLGVEGTDETLEVSQEVFWIGRDRGCDYQVRESERTVSKRHCKIVCDGIGVRIENNSRNPVWVNGERVAMTAKLESGDRVKLPGADQASIEFCVAIPLYRLRVRAPSGVEDYRVVFDAKYEIGRRELGECGGRDKYAIDVGIRRTTSDPPYYISRQHCVLQHDAGSESTWVKCLSKVNHVELDRREVTCKDGLQQLHTDATFRIKAEKDFNSPAFYEFTKLALVKPAFEAQVEVMQADEGPWGGYGETLAMDEDEDFGPSSVEHARGEGWGGDGSSEDSHASSG
ncbi:hypothetical protein T484DRAFT_1896135, partial [Baffinella frigidus]